MKNKHLTPAQVGQQWGVSDVTVRSYIQQGLLPAMNLSLGKQRARYFVRPEDAQAFIEMRRSGSLDIPNKKTGA